MNLDLARRQFAKAWTFWVFRRRVGATDIPAASGLPAGLHAATDPQAIRMTA